MTERERWEELVGALRFGPARQAALILKGPRWLERVEQDRKGDDEAVAEFHRLRAQGWPDGTHAHSVRAMARRCGRHPRTIARWLENPPRAAEIVDITLVAPSAEV